jgi:hypothetical protein
MKKEVLAEMSKSELMDLAKKNKFNNFSKLNKNELIALLSEESSSSVKTATVKNKNSVNQDMNIEVQGESKKFEIYDTHIDTGYRPMPVTTREIPGTYNDTKIVLLVRDPFWIYTYWDIDNEKRNELNLHHGHNKHMVLRVYDVTDVVFNGFNAHSSFDLDINDFTNNWYIKLPAPNRSYCVDIAIINEHGEYVLIARSNTVQVPRDTVSDQMDEEWMIPDDLFNSLYRLSGGYKLHELSGSEAIMKRLHQMPNMSSGIFSSSENRPKEYKQKGFWMVVDTELIVYGATEPDADVTVQGQKIDLNPDGTFSLRFSLPNGTHEIPVVGVSADGEFRKEITPIVNRETITR